MIDFDAMARAEVFTAPYRFMTAAGALTRDQAAAVRRDYPEISKSGYHPLSQFEAKGAFAALIDDLQSPRLAEILSDKLDLDLEGKPRMIAIRKLSKAGDGRIHNDSASKIATMLIYLNDAWDGKEGGAIRALNGPDSLDDYALEVAPLAGNVFAFARSDESWHAHPPFTGERYVVQTTFLVSEEALARKENRGGLQLLMKQLNPFAQ